MIKLIKAEKINKEQVLKEELNLENIEIKKTKHGKPYIEGNPIHFSFSDTKEMDVLVISDKNIGVDIQKIENKWNYMKVAKRVFNQDELSYVVSGGLNKFYIMWTRMESLVKFLGKGIFYKRPSVIKDVITIDNEKVFFYSKEIDGYMLSICSLEEIKDGDI